MVPNIFIFTPIFGEDEPILTTVIFFKMGWFNHQTRFLFPDMFDTTQTRHTSKKRVLETFQASAGAMLSEVTKDEVWRNHPKNAGEFGKGNGWKWEIPGVFF